YLQVIQAKTAVLFAASAQVGALVAERPAAEEEALRCYGENLGMAFQVVDDVLDYLPEATDRGKALGDDFREGKLTLPVVLASRKGSDEENAFWRRSLEKGDQDDDDLPRALELRGRHQAIEGARQRAQCLARRPGKPLR